MEKSAVNTFLDPADGCHVQFASTLAWVPGCLVNSIMPKFTLFLPGIDTLLLLYVAAFHSCSRFVMVVIPAMHQVTMPAAYQHQILP